MWKVALRPTSQMTSRQNWLSIARSAPSASAGPTSKADAAGGLAFALSVPIATRPLHRSRPAAQEGFPFVQTGKP
jgi:hypothetical protein